MFIFVIIFKAIHGFRETERKHWYPHNRKIIEKIAEIAFKGQIMPHIHILDLAENGVIKPHVDSSRVSKKLIVIHYSFTCFSILTKKPPSFVSKLVLVLVFIFSSIKCIFQI